MFYSPLRYPGGKSKMCAYVTETIKANGLVGGSYVEPFAGGAAIAWYLLLNSIVEKVYVNDLDPSIYAFWFAVLKETDAICDLVENADVSIDEWHHQRSIHNSSSATLLERGFATFFLNRTNRSGIINGGVIGGIEQNGKYLIDCRFSKGELINRIRKIASKTDQIYLSNLDGADFIKEVLPEVEQKCLVNIDPPYYVKGKGLYQNFFRHDDHVALSEAIKTIQQCWMVTYDNTPEIQDIYHDFELEPFGLSYTASVKRIGSEILILDPNLTRCAYPPNITFPKLNKLRKQELRSLAG